MEGEFITAGQRLDGKHRQIDYENESKVGSGNPIILSDPRQEVELTDVAVFFVADRPPWELVEQGLIMRNSCLAQYISSFHRYESAPS